MAGKGDDSDDFEVRASRPKLEQMLSAIEAVREHCPAEHREILGQMQGAAADALRESDTAAAVRQLEPMVEEAEKLLERVDIPKLIALLACKPAIEAWHQSGSQGPLSKAKSEWVTDARDQVIVKLSRGLLDPHLSEHLRDTVYRLVASDKPGASRMMVGRVRQGPTPIAILNMLRIFDLSDAKHALEFNDQFYNLALNEKDRKGGRVVDVISRGGRTTLSMLRIYLDKLAKSSPRLAKPKPVVIRVLMPEGVPIDREAWSNAAEVLIQHNAYLWVRRTTTMVQLHGNLIRRIRDDDAFDLERWWRGNPNSDNHIVRDLHLAMRGTLAAMPVYLYIPSELLGQITLALARQIADGFDNLWSQSHHEGLAPRLYL